MDSFLLLYIPPKHPLPSSAVVQLTHPLTLSFLLSVNHYSPHLLYLQLGELISFSLLNSRMRLFLCTAVLQITAVQARFGQEQGNGAIAAIGALSNLGQPGQAATLSGQSIQFLLAAANPCGKLTQADLILSQLGTSDAAVAAARGLVAAEQNFNPFVVSIPSICSDPTLPKSAQLRGVVPLVDPAVAGSDTENKNAQASKTNPFPADGLSVAQVMAAQGFSNFTSVGVNGNKQANSGKPAAGSKAGNNGSGQGNASADPARQSIDADCANTHPTTMKKVVSPTAVASR